MFSFLHWVWNGIELEMGQWYLQDIEYSAFNIFRKGYLESILVNCIVNHIIDSTLSKWLRLRWRCIILVLVCIRLKHTWCCSWALLHTTLTILSYFCSFPHHGWALFRSLLNMTSHASCTLTLIIPLSVIFISLFKVIVRVFIIIRVIVAPEFEHLGQLDFALLWSLYLFAHLVHLNQYQYIYYHLLKYSSSLLLCSLLICSVRVFVKVHACYWSELSLSEWIKNYQVLFSFKLQFRKHIHWQGATINCLVKEIYIILRHLL